MSKMYAEGGTGAPGGPAGGMGEKMEEEKKGPTGDNSGMATYHIAYHITSRHITSRHITSHHITSQPHHDMRSLYAPLPTHSVLCVMYSRGSGLMPLHRCCVFM